ncbi:MAG: flagellar biosynthesis protein FlhF [Desulfosoma sp.]
MQVKTFTAPTMQQALELVRKELGPEAILLGNRKFKDTEGKPCIEITAAVDRTLPKDLNTEQVKKETPTPPQDIILHEQLEDIRGLLSLLISAKDTFLRLQGHEPVSQLFQHLLLRGLNEKNAFTLLQHILSTFTDTKPSKSQLLDALSCQLADRVSLVDPFSGPGPRGERPMMYVFLGPTGVGKTTTLAKVAAYLKVKRKLSIGLISLDTYRIGALDQLKTYADILDVPLKVAQTRLELVSARESLKETSLVLVDTTGRNYLNGQSIQDLEEIFRDLDGVYPFLVLSATAKDEDLRHVIQRFWPLAPQSLIFTKIDETLTPGTILNPLLRFPHPVSYLGVGQRVPEDLVKATHKRILSFFFPRGQWR